MAIAVIGNLFLMCLPGREPEPLQLVEMVLSNF